MQKMAIWYREYNTSPALSPDIECYWARTADPMCAGGQDTHRVVPDGCIDIVVEFDGCAVEAGGRIMTAFDDRASVVGAMSRPLIVNAAPGTSFLGVRFKPGKATQFLGVTAGDLTDQSIPLGEIWRRDDARVEARLTERQGIGRKLALLETALLERLKYKKDDDPYIGRLVRLILDRRGAVSIEALSEYAGISRQHVARKFDQHVGISPKLFCRIMRFQDLMTTIRRSGKVDWATTALDFGYYDQAHMISDFKEFCGLTPASFVALG